MLTISTSIKPDVSVQNLIVSAICEGLYLAKVDIFQSGGEYSNRAGAERNDFIANCFVDAAAESDDVIHAKLRLNNGYETPVLYHPKTRSVYTTIREHNFHKNFIARTSFEKMYFQDAFVDINGPMELPEQMMFESMELPDGIQDERLLHRDEISIAELQSKIMALFGEKPEHHFIVCFDISGYKLTRICARVVTSDLRTLHEFDWRDAIGVDYSEVIDDAVAAPIAAEQSPLNIKIKPNITAPQTAEHTKVVPITAHEEEVNATGE